MRVDGRVARIVDRVLDAFEKVLTVAESAYPHQRSARCLQREIGVGLNLLLPWLADSLGSQPAGRAGQKSARTPGQFVRVSKIAFIPHLLGDLGFCVGAQGFCRCNPVQCVAF